MKLRKLWSLLIALCLAGCGLPGRVPETTAPDMETTAPTVQTQIPTTQPTTQPPETQPPETQPPQPLSRPEPADADFVRVQTYIPELVVDLRYATDNNFTGRTIYEFTDGWLRYGTVKKLMAVQRELKEMGLFLKLWDGFRPPSAQFKLWEICPDPTYVANPNNGFSSHSRGNTVDITLVDAQGRELVMPTGFDDFSPLADRDYSDCTQEAADNARLLEGIMEKYGFRPYAGEWWHFSDTQSYGVDKDFEPQEPASYYADCQEYISLRPQPSTAGEAITKIPAGETFTVYAKHGDFAWIEYREVFGYVLRDYIQPAG